MARSVVDLTRARAARYADTVTNAWLAKVREVEEARERLAELQAELARLRASVEDEAYRVGVRPPFRRPLWRLSTLRRRLFEGR